jgi:hypothetical protein
MLKLYRVEGGTFIHEIDAIHPDFSNHIIMPQMYGDCLIWRTFFASGVGVEFVFHSISKNETVARFTFPSVKDCYQASSNYTPNIYYCCQDSNHNYLIHEIDAMNHISKLLFSDHIPENVRDRYGIQPMKLEENEHGTFLEICQGGIVGRSVEIFDVQKRKMIACIRFLNELKLMKSYYTNIWPRMRYNPGTEYYCTTTGGKKFPYLVINVTVLRSSLH